MKNPWISPLSEKTALARTVHNQKTIPESLSRYGLSLAEYAVLVQTGLTPRPAADVAWHSGDRDYSFGHRVPLEELQAAVTSCLAKGWLFVVTEPWILATQQMLRADCVIGPIAGLPMPGELDLTVSGSEVLARFRSALPEPPSLSSGAVEHLERNPFRCICRLVTKGQYRKERGYTIRKPDREKVIAGYQELGGFVVSATEPMPIGPWCITWRNRLPGGFVMDIEFIDAPA